MVKADAAFQGFVSTRYFASLDGIRCFCILAVLEHHTTDFHSILPMTTRGFLGVDMFFVLSGFLICNLLLQEKQVHGGISLRKFYARRTLRIFPIYYGLLLALCLVYGVVAQDANTGPQFFALLPFYLTYTSNWIVPQAANLALAWSLAAEEQFYVVWPTVEKLLKEKALLVVLAAFIALNQLVNFQIITPWLSEIGLPYEELAILQATFTPICLGILLAHALRARRVFRYVWRVLGSPRSPALTAGLLILAINVPTEGVEGWPRLLVHVLMAVFLASCVVREQHCLKRLLTIALLKRIGMISYGVYLYHMWVLHIVRTGVERLSLPAFPGHEFLLVTLLTIGVADVSFRFYETPILKLRHRFSRLKAPQVSQT